MRIMDRLPKAKITVGELLSTAYLTSRLLVTSFYFQKRINLTTAII